MKGMFDSPEAFEAHTTIDAGMWMLHNIANENGANWNWDTGEGTQILFDQKDAEAVVDIFTDIIEAKEFIGDTDLRTDKTYLAIAKEWVKNPNATTEEMQKVVESIPA